MDIAIKEKNVLKKEKNIIKLPKAKILFKKTKEEEMGDVKNYIEGVGRRKTSVARARFLVNENPVMTVNDKPLEQYFFTPELARIATSGLKKIKLLNKFSISVRIKGGGIHSQAEAMRHATARALIKFNPEFRIKLKKAGYLTRDPRAKERRKFGLKKARKAPQWSKR